MIMLTQNDDTGKKPVCSVCIANYNGAHWIQDCIESVYRQDGDLAVEIIVHDDASTDDSIELIRSRFPEVTLLTSRENVGFCVSNNRMAALARGEYLLLLNNDLVLHPDAIRTLHQAAVERKGPAILSLPQYDAHYGKLIDMGELLDPFLNPVPNLDPARGSVAMVIGACLWIPASLWHELGGFPEWFGNLAEDMHLCCLARLKGYPVAALSGSGYDHWVGGSFLGGKVADGRLRTSFRRRALSERNKSYVMCMYYPSPLFELIFPLHVLLLLLEGAALSLLKRSTRFLREIYLPCLASLWKRRKELSTLRAAAQSQRSCSLEELLSAHTLMPHKLKMLMKYGMPSLR
jgi:GT2 family glycosyltransferase